MIPEYEPFGKLTAEYGELGCNPEIREPLRDYDADKEGCPLCGCCPIDPVMCGYVLDAGNQNAWD